MAQSAERLVGRADELGQIEDALDRLDLGRPMSLVLVGEPGIGKTRLLGEVARLADARGQLVLSGSASELEQDMPFWVFVDGLNEYVHGLDPERLELLAPAVRSELAMLLPSLSAHAASGGGTLHHERYRSHQAVRALLELLAEIQPVVLVLDDLHWGDPASVELLITLLQRPPDAAVMLAFAVRPRQLAARLVGALERAIRAGTVTRLELGALTRAEADDLLGDALGPRKADALYSDSGGNPFYLEQLARMFERGVAGTGAGSGVSFGDVYVPPVVAAAISEEIDLLSAAARVVLEGAAVAGDPFDPELAAAAAGTSESAAIAALDDLLRLDLVRTTEVPRRFRFRHPLVRRSVYESTPGGWRLGAHERTAAALLARGAPATTRAHHVEHAARHGDQAAIVTLREAGDAAAHRAPASAARWFAAAARLVTAATPNDERIDLLLAYARSLAASGQFEQSRATLLECAALVPDDAAALRTRLAAECAGVERLLGRHTQARARLSCALAELADPHSPEAVALMLELASDSLLRAKYDEIHDWAARAAESAARLDDPALIAAARALQAFAAAVGGDVEAALGHCDETATHVDRLSDEQVAHRLDALQHLATAEMYVDRFEASGRHAERALRIGRATGQGDLFPLIFPMLGTALWVQGRVVESGRVFDDAVDAARLADNAQALAWNLFNRSFAATAAGELEIALATATESVEVGQRLDDSLVAAHAAWGLAEALQAIGKPAEAAALMVERVGGEELRLIPGGWRTKGLELMTRCLLELGMDDEAGRAATAARECAAAFGLPMATGIADRATAELALARGDPTAAAEQALGSAVGLESAGCLLDAAISRALAGRALALAGETERAADELERAAAAFESFGCARHRAEVERELRKLGRRYQSRTRPGNAGATGVASLSDRELEVARLIVDRKTNPEIAAELFLSTKTVETHVRNMFRKLNVGSRVELARVVERTEGPAAR